MKLFNKICAVTSVMLLLTVTANAYIDPSVTTYAIQAIAGVVIAVGAVAGIVWTKMKKKAKEKLNIDLEGKKEVEEDVVEYTEEVKETPKEDMAAKTEAAAKTE
ncbi:MAG: hypothetical protein GXW99_10765 [Clostridiales bacterium]|nr:hypothetical protein [Clostridiales bacterium]